MWMVTTTASSTNESFEMLKYFILNYQKVETYYNIKT